MVTLLYAAIAALLIGVALSELGNNVEHLLVYHFAKCMVPHKDMNNSDVAGNNVIDVLQQMAFCWETTLHRCIDHSKAFDYINK